MQISKKRIRRQITALKGFEEGKARQTSSIGDTDGNTFVAHTKCITYMGTLRGDMQISLYNCPCHAIGIAMILATRPMILRYKTLHIQSKVNWNEWNYLKIKFIYLKIILPIRINMFCLYLSRKSIFFTNFLFIY